MVKNIERIERKDLSIFIFGLKACHITGIIISLYMTAILLSIGYGRQSISYIIALIGVSFPVVSMASGILSDFYGRAKIYTIGKILCCILMFFAILFFKDKLIVFFLFAVVSIENGIEPLISAAATDISNDSNRMKIFGWLSIGGSSGMIVISLVSAYVLNFNITLYFSILIICDLLTIIFMKSLPKKLFDHPKKMKSKSENGEGYSISKMIVNNKFLLVFSFLMIAFSILSSQLNYTFVLQLKNDFGNQVENKLGLLLSIYYFTMSVSIYFISKVIQKNTCIYNMVLAGSIYFVSMLLIAISNGIILLAIGLITWAVAQVLVYVNNSVFVAEHCRENNVGIMTVFFTIISSSGVVIGPILSGILIQMVGLKSIWWIMTGLSLFGTISMYSLKFFNEKQQKGNYTV